MEQVTVNGTAVGVVAGRRVTGASVALKAKYVPVR
jgi:hypothetical protein